MGRTTSLEKFGLPRRGRSDVQGRRKWHHRSSFPLPAWAWWAHGQLQNNQICRQLLPPTTTTQRQHTTAKECALSWQIWGEIRYQAERALHNGWLVWPAWGKSTPSLWSPWAEAGVDSSPCLHFPLSSTTPILWPGGPGVFGSSPLRSFLFAQLANDLQRISFGLRGRCLCCSVSLTQGCWRVGPGAGLSCPGLR